MPELLLELSDKHLLALGRLMWDAVAALSPLGALTRPRAGIRGSTLLLALPGGPKAARVALSSVIGLLPVAMRWASGPTPDCKSADEWFESL
jgi:gephyrin